MKISKNSKGVGWENKEETKILDGVIISDTVIRIEIVSELPEIEEDGVLYIVK